MQKLELKLELQNKCQDCGNKEFIVDHEMGETICKVCGLVLQTPELNSGPEWRAFTREEKESRIRVGIPSSFSIYDKGLTTTIDRTSRDAQGRKLSLKKRIQMQRLRKWQIRSRAHSSIERNLTQAMNEINILSDKLAIPKSVKEKAAVIYRKALDKDLVRGRSISGMVAGALYAACRFTRTPRNLKEIASISSANRKEISRDYRIIVENLEIQMPIHNPKTFISKIAIKANLSAKAQEFALQIIREAQKGKYASGKDPTGLAAAALYIGSIKSGKKITQREIASAAGVTEVTVRNRYKSLRKQLRLEFN